MRRSTSRSSQADRRTGGQTLWFALLVLSASPPIRLSAQELANNSGALFLLFPVGAQAVAMGQTACAPTGNRRKRAPELLARAWAERWSDGTTESAVATKTAWARPIPSFRRCIVRSEVFRLIDQHDRDVVFDR